MLTQLLTVAKIVAPVGCITAVGGGVYFIAANVDTTSNQHVYLLVKGETTTASDVDSSKELAVNTSGKITKNYICQLSLKNKSTLVDSSCSLFKLNSSTSTSDTISYNRNMFNDSQLELTKANITSSSHHFLKVTKSFYNHLTKATTSNEKAINLLDASNKSKKFGIVSEISKLNLSNTKDLKKLETNLFLARVTSPSTEITADLQEPLSCKISAEKIVPCKLYKNSTKLTVNSLSKTELSNLGVVAKADIKDGNYLVVDLQDTYLDVSDLKNKTIEIHHTVAATANASATTAKIAEISFDQVLIGAVNKTTLASSTIFPLTEKTRSFLVSKKTGSEFTDINSATGSKNYVCQYTLGTNINYDDSCLVKVFPTPSGDTKIHSYSAITTPSTLTDITTGGIAANDHFLLSVDSNKLFNLSVDWTKEPAIDIVIKSTPTATPAKTATFSLLQEVTEGKATGKTNSVLVKFKSVLDSSNATMTNGKCATTETDTTGFVCTFKKATTSNGTDSTIDLTKTTFSNDVHATWTGLTVTDYFVAEFTSAKDIKDFSGENLFYFATINNKLQKITFDIVATMGGTIPTASPTKAAYFLEPTRPITAPTP